MGAGVHVVVGEHAHALKLVVGEQVRFIDDEDGGAAAFGVLDGQRVGGLRDEGGVVEARGATQGDHDGVVDAAGAHGGVTDADDDVPGRVEGGEGARTATVLPTPTSPVMTPRARSPMHQVTRAVASPWAVCRCSIPGARSRP
jgi:hypothetical protein